MSIESQDFVAAIDEQELMPKVLQIPDVRELFYLVSSNSQLYAAVEAAYKLKLLGMLNQPIPADSVNTIPPIAYSDFRWFAWLRKLWKPNISNIDFTRTINKIRQGKGTVLDLLYFYDNITAIEKEDPEYAAWLRKQCSGLAKIVIKPLLEIGQYAAAQRDLIDQQTPGIAHPDTKAAVLVLSKYFFQDAQMDVRARDRILEAANPVNHYAAHRNEQETFEPGLISDTITKARELAEARRAGREVNINDLLALEAASRESVTEAAVASVLPEPQEAKAIESKLEPPKAVKLKIPPLPASMQQKLDAEQKYKLAVAAVPREEATIEAVGKEPEAVPPSLPLSELAEEEWKRQQAEFLGVTSQPSAWEAAVEQQVASEEKSAEALAAAGLQPITEQPPVSVQQPALEQPQVSAQQQISEQPKAPEQVPVTELAATPEEDDVKRLARCLLQMAAILSHGDFMAQDFQAITQSRDLRIIMTKFAKKKIIPSQFAATLEQTVAQLTTEANEQKDKDLGKYQLYLRAFEYLQFMRDATYVSRLSDEAGKMYQNDIARVNSLAAAYKKYSLHEESQALIKKHIADFQNQCGVAITFFVANPEETSWSEQVKKHAQEQDAAITAQFATILKQIEASSLSKKTKELLVFELQSGRYDEYWHDYRKYYADVVGQAQPLVVDCKDHYSLRDLYLEKELDEKDREELLKLGVLKQAKKSANSVVFTRGLDGSSMVFKRVADKHLLLNEAHNSGLFAGVLGARSANWKLVVDDQGNILGEACKAVPGFIEYGKLRAIAQSNDPEQALSAKLAALQVKRDQILEKIAQLEKEIATLRGTDLSSSKKPIMLTILRGYQQDLQNEIGAWEHVQREGIIDFQNHRVDVTTNSMPQIMAKVTTHAFMGKDWDRHAWNWGGSFMDGEFGVSSIDYDKSLDEGNRQGTQAWAITPQKLRNFPNIQCWYWPADYSYRGKLWFRQFKNDNGYQETEARAFAALKDNPQFKEQMMIEWMKQVLLNEEFYRYIREQRLGHVDDPKLNAATQSLALRRKELMGALVRMQEFRELFLDSTQREKLLEQAMTGLQSNLEPSVFSRFVKAKQESTVNDLKQRCMQFALLQTHQEELIQKEFGSFGQKLVELMQTKGYWFNEVSHADLMHELRQLFNVVPSAKTLVKKFAALGVELSESEARNLKQGIYRQMLNGFAELIPDTIRIKQVGFWGSERTKKGIQELMKIADEYVIATNPLAQEEVLNKVCGKFVELGVDVRALGKEEALRNVLNQHATVVFSELACGVMLSENGRLVQQRLVANGLAEFFYKLFYKMPPRELERIVDELAIIDDSKKFKVAVQAIPAEIEKFTSPSHRLIVKKLDDGLIQPLASSRTTAPELSEQRTQAISRKLGGSGEALVAASTAAMAAGMLAGPIAAAVAGAAVYAAAGFFSHHQRKTAEQELRVKLPEHAETAAAPEEAALPKLPRGIAAR